MTSATGSGWRYFPQGGAPRTDAFVVDSARVDGPGAARAPHRPDPPDPGPSGVDRPPGRGRSGLRRRRAGSGLAGKGRLLARRLEALAPRQALHAALLAFRHPVSGTPLRLISPWPADLWPLLEAAAGSGRPDRAGRPRSIPWGFSVPMADVRSGRRRPGRPGRRGPAVHPGRPALSRYLREAGIIRVPGGGSGGSRHGQPPRPDPDRGRRRPGAGPGRRSDRRSAKSSWSTGSTAASAWRWTRWSNSIGEARTGLAEIDLDRIAAAVFA